jgi:hypothetical protein
MSAFTFSSSHEFYFSTKEPVPLAQVAESLLALERIVKLAPQVLQGLTQIEIQGVDVYVDAIESGSLLEKVFIKLVFRTEEELDAFLDRIGENIRKPGMSRSLLIGTVIAALVGYGAWLAAKVSNPPGQTTITANNNTIINLGAGQLDLTPEAFHSILVAAVSDKKELAQSAVKIFHAARADGQASLVIDGNESTRFSPDVISATPRKVEIEKQDKVEHLRDVDLQIRATDLDSVTRGWAAVLPGKIDRRVRLKLDQGVKPSEVADKFSVRADISVYYRLDKAGNKLVPDYILLREVIKD